MDRVLFLALAEANAYGPGHQKLDARILYRPLEIVKRSVMGNRLFQLKRGNRPF